MSNPFKIGDEVIFIDNKDIMGNLIPDMTLNKIYKINYVNTDYINVYRDNCMTNNFFYWRFKLHNSASPVTTTAKPIDTVQGSSPAKVQRNLKDTIWCSCDICEKRTYCTYSNGPYLCPPCRKKEQIVSQ